MPDQNAYMWTEAERLAAIVKADHAEATARGMNDGSAVKIYHSGARETPIELARMISPYGPGEKEVLSYLNGFVDGFNSPLF
jgi:hypothetical protein